MLIPHWPIYTGPNKDMEYCLTRMYFILQKLNNPNLKLRNIIHITGTKGKGSTALYISNILRRAGYKVNTYISPHIYECNERILLNGVPVRDEELFEATEKIRLICENDRNVNDFFKNNDSLNLEPSLFESLTCSAFEIMSKNNADFNVIEVGMGGLFDATNVFKDNPPLICVFTPIHMDHVKFLGDSIEKIAMNKSALIKEGTKAVVLSSQPKEVKDILKNVAKENKVADNFIFCYGEDYEVFKDEENSLPFFESSKIETLFPFPQPNMAGDYQLINAGCAIMACLLCSKLGFAEQLSLQSIEDGIHNTVNIVRMQQIKSGKLFEKLPKNSLFYVDGAHNQLSAHALSKFIQDFKKKNKDYKICVAVARTKGAKNIDFLKEFLVENIPIVDLVVCTRANLESIPEPPEKIVQACESLLISCSVAYDIGSVVDCVVDFAENQKVLFICTGSLYIARDIFKFS